MTATDETGACLDLVREALVQHGVKMESCPPILYPEAIHNLFVWGIKAGQECLKKHGAQPQEHQVRCISDWITSINHPKGECGTDGYCAKRRRNDCE